MLNLFFLFVMLAGAVFCIVDFARGAVGRSRRVTNVRERLAFDLGEERRVEAKQRLQKESSNIFLSDEGRWSRLARSYSGALQETPPPVLMGLAVAGFGFGAMSAHIAFAHLGLTLMVGVIFGLAGPALALARARSVRQSKCDKQLPDALDLVMRSLRAGHPLQVAIAAAGRDIPAPLGAEFAIASQEMAFGLDLPSAVSKMSDRIGTDDIDMFAVVVRVQQRAGGNLVEVLGRFAELMRERFRMRAKALALSAEGRLSGVLLFLLPFIMFALINITTPDYYAMVRGEPMLPWIFLGTFCLMTIGGFIIYRMVNFRI